MKKLPALLIFAFLICGTVSLSAQDIGRETRVDSVLASVNGEPITLLDVLIESGREEMRLASMFSGARLYSEIAKLRKQVIDEIIVRKLVYGSYKEKPFPIEEQYIENLMDSLAVSMGGGSRGGLIKRQRNSARPYRNSARRSRRNSPWTSCLSLIHISEPTRP